MMSLFKKTKKSKDDTPLLNKILSLILKNNIDLSPSDNLFFLGGYLYSTNSYDQFRKNIKNHKQMHEFIGKFEQVIYDNNFELYLLVQKKKYLLISIYDPYDYLDKERILDIWEVKESFIQKVDKTPLNPSS